MVISFERIVLLKPALLVGIALIALIGCKKGAKADCDFSEEMRQLQDLEESYESNPTKEYCEASKKFMLKLLNQAEDCPKANKQEIERVKKLIETDDCSSKSPE